MNRTESLTSAYTRFPMFEKSIVRIVPILLAIAAPCLTANAQDPIGTLEGQIPDPSSALVSGAEVSAHSAQTGLTRSIHSSREGSFHFSNLPIGEYTLTVKAKDFALFSVSPIRIDIGQ